MRVRITTVFLVFLLLSAIPAFAGGSSEGAGGDNGEEDDVDYLGVAAVMLRDGNFDRAEDALNNVNTELESFDETRYYTLWGLLHLRRNRFSEAIENLEAAKAAEGTDPVINVYLGQAYYRAEEYERAIDAIEAVPNITRYPDLLGVKAEAQWRLGWRDEAFETLADSIDLFPSRTGFLEQRVFYLIELDLTQAAADESLRYLGTVSGNPEAYVTIGEALRRGGQVNQAIESLEIGLLRFPESRRIRLALAQAYLDNDQPRTAGRLVEEAAALDFNLYHDAAEIFRRAGALERALFLNSQVPDEAAKTRQRFNLLLAMERYEEAVALEERLERLGLLDEDALRYSIAYAYFQTRQLDKAQSYVSRIGSQEYFRQATQLRRAIEIVRAEDVQYL